MLKSRQFLSMPVISIIEGQQVGTIKDLVIDSSQKQVVALVIEQKGLFKERKYISFDKITSVGNDAITIDRCASAERGNNLPNIIKLTRENVQIKGTRIITDKGTFLGHVDEYYVDSASGQIIGLEFKNKYLDNIIQGKAFLDSHYVHTIGREVIICTEDSVHNVVKLNEGLQEKFKSIRDTGSQVWDNTRQRSRNLGNSLSKIKTPAILKKDKTQDIDD